MSRPVYCILSGGTVHCVPVTIFSNSDEITLEKLACSPQISSLPDSTQSPPPCSPASLAIKKKNLLYTLNNPSLSDLESDVSRRFSTGSHSQDDDDTAFEQHDIQILSPKTDLLKAYPGSGSLRFDSSRGENEGLHHTLLNYENGANGANPVIINIGTDQAVGSDEEDGCLISEILHDYSTHAVYLPQFFVDLKENLESDYSQIKSLLTKVFPSWCSSIKIKQLTGGITNMLLSCSHEATNETLLMRVYGQGTNLIIDRNREFISHLVLNSLKLAPSIHARFANGLIYGFLPGRSLDPCELSNTNLYPLIAQQLGNWHNSINCEYIEDGVSTIRKYTAGVKKRTDSSLPYKTKNGKSETKSSKSVNNIWDLIEEWIKIVPENEALASTFDENTQDVDVTVSNVREVVLKEFEWLKKTLKLVTKSPVVVSHCDLLSGNIIVPSSGEFTQSSNRSDADLPSLSENPVQFIDYEYMLPAPRAFDIANHFAEWQGFDCNRSAIPVPSSANPVMVRWCKGYLNSTNASDNEVNALIDEIACYYGMPGFYWGIWAMIQSKLSTIDFNYAEYGKLRLEEYWLWKKQFTATRL